MVSESLKRRLTTILIADVAGYSRLVRADEESTLTTLGAYRNVFDGLIDRHDGRVFGSGGDSVLAEFGSAVEAVRCAISCQEEIAAHNAELADERKLMFRIGINVGDVIVRDGDLLGDGVNVAARLEGLAEPGGVCLSGSVFEQIRHKLSLDFEAMGSQRVKNIAEPVAAYRLIPGRGSASAAAGSSRAGGRRIPVLATAAVIIVAAGGLALWRPWEPEIEPANVERMALPLPDRPSIAVLPFSNISDDPSQEYFADGMTEDLITDLSKVSGLFVIARNSVFTYKGKAVKVRQVAEDLGVRYILEGSVRRAGDQVRVNAQLIDATTGGHIWAERYDGTLESVFALQDQVTRQIVTALTVSLTTEEQAERAKPETDDPRAYELFLQGWEHYQRRTPEHYAKALKFFEQAVALDPDYGRAHAAIAWIYWNSSERRGEWYSALGVDQDEVKVRAQDYLERALKHPVPMAHQVASQVLFWNDRFDAAILEAEKAVAMDANDADSHAALAEALIRGGRPGEAVQHLDQARRLDPHNQAWFTFLHGLAEFGMDRFEAAAASFERAIELDPDTFQPDPMFGWCRPCEPLAAAYGHLGRKDDAQRMVKKLREYWDRYNTTSAVYWWPFKQSADTERLVEGLHKAGVPKSGRLSE